MTRWIGSALAIGLTLSAFATEKPLMTQKNLAHSWVKDNPNYLVAFTPEVARAECLKNERKSLAIQSNYNIPVQEGKRYRITFEARGSIKAISLKPMYDGKGTDNLFTDAKVTEEWENYTASLTVPKGIRTFACAIYAWNRTGYFEVRNFQMIECSNDQE